MSLPRRPGPGAPRLEPGPPAVPSRPPAALPPRSSARGAWIYGLIILFIAIARLAGGTRPSHSPPSLPSYAPSEETRRLMESLRERKDVPRGEPWRNLEGAAPPQGAEPVDAILRRLGAWKAERPGRTPPSATVAEECPSLPPYGNCVPAGE